MRSLPWLGLHDSLYTDGLIASSLMRWRRGGKERRHQRPPLTCSNTFRSEGRSSSTACRIQNQTATTRTIIFDKGQHLRQQLPHPSMPGRSVEKRARTSAMVALSRVSALSPRQDRRLVGRPNRRHRPNSTPCRGTVTPTELRSLEKQKKRCHAVISGTVTVAVEVAVYLRQPLVAVGDNDSLSCDPTTTAGGAAKHHALPPVMLLKTVVAKSIMAGCRTLLPTARDEERWSRGREEGRNRSITSWAQPPTAAETRAGSR